MTKVDIFSGFLGAGKTTLIKKLIEEGYDEKNIVIIENEFGEIGIDSGFLKDTGIQINEMNSGCICCTLVGDFSKALNQVVEEYKPGRILIEPSGVGKLSDVILAVENLNNPEIELDRFITVADAGKYNVYMKNFGEFYENQIQFAATIILSHTDNVPEKNINEVISAIRAKNKDANLVTSSWESISGRQILEASDKKDGMKEDLEQLKEEVHCCHHHREHEHNHAEEEHCCHHHGAHEHNHAEEEHCCHHHGEHEHHHADEVFDEIGVETANRYSQEEIGKILEKFDTEEYGYVLRAKGIVRGESEFIHFDYIPHEADVRKGTPEVIGKICVIGVNLDVDKIKELFRVR